MELKTLKTEPRPTLGSAEARRVRRAGRLPAVVYGLSREPHACSIDLHTFEIVLHEGVRTYKLDVGGKTEAVLLKDVQWDAFGKDMVHVDFVRIDLTAKVRVSVTLEFKGQPELTANAVVDHVSEEIWIECLPTEIPRTIVVNIAGLTIGHHIEAREVQLPAGITLSDEPHKTLVSYHYKHVEAAAPVGAPAEGAVAEPVVLKEKKPDEAAEAKPEKK